MASVRARYRPPRHGRCCGDGDVVSRRLNYRPGPDASAARRAGATSLFIHILALPTAQAGPHSFVSA
jgi:hypothetical protein